MTTFPAFEAALEAAAHRHYGRRRRRLRRWWPALLAAPALAASAVVALVLVWTPEPPVDAAQAATLVVPAETVARSHALTQAAREPAAWVAHAELAATAAQIASSVPYPPQMSDPFNWPARPADPTDMESINYRNEVQWLVEYRAGCLWLGFWESAWRTGDEPALAAATSVIDDIPRWPSNRTQGGTHWPAMAAAADARDPEPVRAERDQNC